MSTFRTVGLLLIVGLVSAALAFTLVRSSLEGSPGSAGNGAADTGDILEIQTLTQPIPTGDTVEHPDFGTQTYFSYGAITGVGDAPASGVVYGRLFEDGTYVSTVNLNMYPAQDGEYVAWLRGEGGEVIKLGLLDNQLGDARHGLHVAIAKDLTLLQTLLVTLEADAESAQSPTRIVAEGTLKRAQQ